MDSIETCKQNELGVHIRPFEQGIRRTTENNYCDNVQIHIYRVGTFVGLSRNLCPVLGNPAGQITHNVV